METKKNKQIAGKPNTGWAVKNGRLGRSGLTLIQARQRQAKGLSPLAAIR